MAGLFIPFFGTMLGSACVFFIKNNLKVEIERVLVGFAAGVMVAASVWSLLIPAIEQSENMGRLSFIPAALGFCVGMVFLLLLDCFMPHVHIDSGEAEGLKSSLKRTTMMIFAIVLHNIPEGMAVGVVLAGYMAKDVGISASGALALSIGIAIQNFPEGAIVAMPLHANGMKKKKTFWYGTLSGAVEPLAGIVTIMLSSLLVPVLPYFLSFAAGAMMYVVVEELIPELAKGKHSNIGAISFMLGFTLMMILDVAL